MLPIEIETWARRVVERVKAGASREDSRVELKTIWPVDHNACARRIAAHCNAARGAPVLWLIGVHEYRDEVPGADKAELSDWWAQIRKEFHGQAPAIHELQIDVDDVEIVALLFDSDRAPFVVKNAAAGKRDGGAVQSEVPWREGTAVRSATREDLLKLLLPLQPIPILEVMRGHVELHGVSELQWEGEVTVYGSMPMGRTIVLPNHLAHAELAPLPGASVDLRVALAAHRDDRPWSHFIPMGGGATQVRTPADDRLHTVHQGDSQILLDGPGFFRVNFTGPVSGTREDYTGPWRDMGVHGQLRAVGLDAVIPFAAELHPATPEPPAVPEPGKHRRYPRWVFES